MPYSFGGVQLPPSEPPSEDPEEPLPELPLLLGMGVVRAVEAAM